MRTLALLWVAIAAAVLAAGGVQTASANDASATINLGGVLGGAVGLVNNTVTGVVKVVDNTTGLVEETSSGLLLVGQSGSGPLDGTSPAVAEVPAPLQQLGAQPSPQAGTSFNIAPASGQVRVKRPGSRGFRLLTAAAHLPVGTVVDARAGSVGLMSARDRRGATQTASFAGATFTVKQDNGRRPITELVLAGEPVRPCVGRKGAAPVEPRTTASGRRRGSKRRLWGSGHGRFRTRGHHGSASVRGTVWLTEDRCDGTFFAVRRGVVLVRDYARKRTVVLRAGGQHLVRAP